MKRVTLTISYDMDDEEKPLYKELQDWIENAVNVQDFNFDFSEIQHRSDEAICDHGECIIRIKST